MYLYIEITFALELNFLFDGVFETRSSWMLYFNTYYVAIQDMSCTTVWLIDKTTHIPFKGKESHAHTDGESCLEK